MSLYAGYQCTRLAPTSHVVLPLMLAHQCGQAFRWRQVATRLGGHGPVVVEWSLCLRDCVVFVIHDAENRCLYHRAVIPSGTSAPKSLDQWLRDYLNLHVPLADWTKEWRARDSVFAKHAARFAGAYILRQDPWECLCA